MKKKQVLVLVSLKIILSVLKTLPFRRWIALVLEISWKIYLCLIMYQERQSKIKICIKNKLP